MQNEGISHGSFAYGVELFVSQSLFYRLYLVLPSFSWLQATAAWAARAAVRRRRWRRRRRRRRRLRRRRRRRRRRRPRRRRRRTWTASSWRSSNRRPFTCATSSRSSRCVPVFSPFFSLPLIVPFIRPVWSFSFDGKICWFFLFVFLSSFPNKYL